MWPLTVFAHRRADRRRKAALIVLLGAYMVERLDGADRARVEREVVDNYKKSPEPPVVWQRYACWEAVAASRAAAMDRLGIPSPLPDASWDVLFRPFHSWSAWALRFDYRPTFVILNFFPMDPVTLEAKALLRRHGFDIPDGTPWALGSLSPVDGTQEWLRASGLYAHWWKSR